MTLRPNVKVQDKVIIPYPLNILSMKSVVQHSSVYVGMQEKFCSKMFILNHYSQKYIVIGRIIKNNIQMI